MDTRDRPDPSAHAPPSRDQPTAEQLLAMAYADGELDAAERATFERRLEAEPALAREVAEYRRLELLARHLAPPEPTDLEWERISRDPIHRAGLGGGFALLSAGTLGMTAWAAVFVATTPRLPLLVKLVLGAAAGGVLLLFLTVLRARLRLRPFDPYTAVRR